MLENEKKLYLENQKLKKENTELKRRVKKYIYENQELKFLTQAKVDEINKQKVCCKEVITDEKRYS